MKLKFQNNEEFYQIDKFEIINDKVIRIYGNNIPENTSGFELYDENDSLNDKYSEYIVIYDICENYIEFTKDTSVYNVYYCYYEFENGETYVTHYIIRDRDLTDNVILIKSGQGKEYAEATLDIEFKDSNNMYNYKVVKNEETNELEVIKITEEEKNKLISEKENKEIKEKQIAFEASIENKVKESKELLSLYLKNHPLVSSCHNNTEAEYNVTSEKQNLMTSHYATYTIEKGLGLNPVLKWNSTGAECEVWTEEEFIQLILEIKAYVEPLVSLQQTYEVQIRKCKTQEELDKIDIIYDVYGINE
jgi:hypothetical protein